MEPSWVIHRAHHMPPKDNDYWCNVSLYCEQSTPTYFVMGWECYNLQRYLRYYKEDIPFQTSQTLF